MSASRKRPKGAFRRPFGLFMSCIILTPTSVGHQDLASLIARQPGVAERGRQHIRSAPSLTALHTATFSFPRPLGTMIPDAPGYQLASLDPRAAGVTGAIRKSDPFYDPFAERAAPPAPRYEFPTVDRRLKGDLLVRRDLQPAPPTPKPKPRTLRDLAEAHEPFAIPQKLIVEAERMQARRVAAAEKAARQAREAMLAIRQPGENEPFAIDESEIVAAARIETQRLADSQIVDRREAAEIQSTEAAETLTAEAPAVDYPPVTAWAQPEAEPFGISEDLIAEAERIEMARNDEETAPETVPAETAAVPDSDTTTETSIPLVENNQIITDEEPRDDDTADVKLAQPNNPAVEMAKLYFGADSFGATHGGLEAYQPGEAPILVPPAKIDPDIKLSALTPSAQLPDYKRDDESSDKDEAAKPGVTNETIAPKGEVTGEGKRPRTPAERLGLTGANRAKQERCLTNAIYFESRGEPERGQMAVAQVVMNRVFSPYYPLTVCGVVYQNAHKHNACQFTFACDNVRDVVTEPEAWETAKRISRDTLDGKIWLPEIGKATHYHATYVSPWWKRTMNKYKTLGIHIFYRPKRWGDGSDEPTWDPTEVEATGSIKAPDKSHATAFNK